MDTFQMTQGPQVSGPVGGAVERPREQNFEEKAWLARHQLHKADDLANRDHSFFSGLFLEEQEIPELGIF